VTVRRLLVSFHLLDRQVVDRDGLLVGKVDDVELSDTEPPRVVALLLGPQALGRRMDGWFGRLVFDVAHRLSPERSPLPTRVAYELVSHVDTAVHLQIPRHELPEPSLERWLRAHIVERIPGAFHAEQ
jgi:sporulation protein YlmC with PRC-barrel domain